MQSPRQAKASTGDRYAVSGAQQATMELVERLRKEALAFPDLRHDPQRIVAYCTHRLQGQTIPDARRLCQYGLHYLRCGQARRLQIRALLDQHGVSRSPLCWPSLELRLERPLKDCPTQGEGDFGPRHAIRHNGHDYVFQPFRKTIDATPALSVNAQLLGLKQASLQPALRHLAAVRIADALGLAGRDGVVPGAWVAIVNGVPGLLMQAVKGKPEGRRNMMELKVKLDGIAGRLANWAIDADIQQTGQPDPAATVHALGMVSAWRDEHGACLSGTWGKRSDRAAQRYESPAYHLSLSSAQVFAWLVNLPDNPAANIVAEPQGIDHPGQARYGAKLLSLAHALPPHHPTELEFEDPHDQAALSGMAIEIRAIAPGLRDALHSERCREMLACLRKELQGYLPQPDLEALQGREQWLRSAQLPDFEADDDWRRGDDLHPTASLRDYVIGFSDKQFGESDDSSSDDDDETEPAQASDC